MYCNRFDLPKAVTHYNSEYCKTCMFCQLKQAFSNPERTTISDPVEYFQSIEPACIGCEHADDWKQCPITETEGNESMEYNNRAEISAKIYEQLEPLKEFDGLSFIADVGKFKNNELLNLYWGDHDRMNNVVQMKVAVNAKRIYITVSTECLDPKDRDMERDYWHTVAAGGDESRFPRAVKFHDGYWWKFKFDKYVTGICGNVDYDTSVGPGHKGDSLIDMMTWLYVNKDFLIESFNVAKVETEQKIKNLATEEQNREQHTMDLLKEVLKDDNRE